MSSFVIDTTPGAEKKFKQTVTFSEPMETGRFAKRQFQAMFIEIDTDEIKTLMREAEDEDAGGRELLKRAVVDLEGIKTAEGEDAEFTPDLLDVLMKRVYIRAAMVKAYFNGITHSITEENRRKN